MKTDSDEDFYDRFVLRPFAIWRCGAIYIFRYFFTSHTLQRLKSLFSIYFVDFAVRSSVSPLWLYVYWACISILVTFDTSSLDIQNVSTINPLSWICVTMNVKLVNW